MGGERKRERGERGERSDELRRGEARRGEGRERKAARQSMSGINIKTDHSGVSISHQRLH